MRNETRLVFTALAAQIALLNGVASATEKFNVSPSVQQTLETAIREIRLGAKEEVRIRMEEGEIDEAQRVAKEAASKIEAAVTGIGNA